MTDLVASLRSRTSVDGTLEVAREYAIVFFFLALFLTLTLTANHFLTWVNLRNNVESGAIYGIVACALTLLLIVGEFDLSRRRVVRPDRDRRRQARVVPRHLAGAARRHRSSRS